MPNLRAHHRGFGDLWRESHPEAAASLIPKAEAQARVSPRRGASLIPKSFRLDGSQLAWAWDLLDRDQLAPSAARLKAIAANPPPLDEIFECRLQVAFFEVA